MLPGEENLYQWGPPIKLPNRFIFIPIVLYENNTVSLGKLKTDMIIQLTQKTALPEFVLIKNGNGFD